MDIFFQDPNEIPLPPAEVRILELRAEPWPDKQRVRVYLELTPFQKRPYIEVILHDANGEEIASSSIVEPLSWKLEFTMHLRGELNNPYTLNARLYYPDGPSGEPRAFTFEVVPPPTSPAPDPA